MKVDFQLHYKEQLKKNISRVRGEIKNRDFQLKIQNWSEKYGFEKEEVENKILQDDMFVANFAKDPSKQNIYEKLAVQFIKSIPFISKFVNLPNNTKLFVVNGEITSKRDNEVKSIDFIFNIGDYKFYCSHKYIRETSGGAQGNQYNDVRNFLRNCKKRSDGNEYFIAICDGPYFDSKISLMNNDFGSSNVKALTIEDLEDYLSQFKKEN